MIEVNEQLRETKPQKDLLKIFGLKNLAMSIGGEFLSRISSIFPLNTVVK